MDAHRRQLLQKTSSSQRNHQQLLLLLSELLALLARTVRVRALSTVLTDVASTLGILAGLLRIRTVTRHGG